MIHNHITRQVGAEVQKRIDALRIGQKMQDLPEELWHESFRYYVKEDPNRQGGPNLRMIRLDPEQPSLTVTGYIYNKFVHPWENRFISVREAARLQGFPDDFVFHGSLTSTQMQVGNAVPIDLARAVFIAVSQHAQTQGIGLKYGLSLFSGAGGMDIGAKQAGIEARVAVEIEQDACNSLSGYFGDDLFVQNSDITTIVKPKELWQERTNLQNVDIVFGGPPCQSFSQAGKQKALLDVRGQLIFEFIRFVNELQPSYFVMENVANLRGVADGLLYEETLKQMRELGYSINVMKLRAVDFGVAQRRERLFFIGAKQGQVAPPQPSHSDVSHMFYEPYKTVGQAFAGLPSLEQKKN